MPKIVLTHRELQMIASGVSLQAILYARNLVAADVRLDPDTLNKYFTGDSGEAFSLSDLYVSDFGKNPTDALSLLEEIASFEFGKGAADTVTLAESAAITAHFTRAFSDASSITEDPAIGFTKIVNDTNNETMSLIESSVMAFDKGESETISLTEAAIQALELGKSDSISVDESLTKVVTFARAFADAFAMDDAATVNAFVKDYDGNKANIFSFSDSESIGFDKATTDSFSFADEPSLGFEKGVIAESVSISESFSFVLRGGTTINAVALNEQTLN